MLRQTLELEELLLVLLQELLVLQQTLELEELLALQQTLELEELLALQQTLGLVEQQLVLPQVQLVLRQILGLVGFLEPLLLLEILLQPVLEQFLLH